MHVLNLKMAPLAPISLQQLTGLVDQICLEKQPNIDGTCSVMLQIIHLFIDRNVQMVKKNGSLLLRVFLAFLLTLCANNFNGGFSDYARINLFPVMFGKWPQKVPGHSQ